MTSAIDDDAACGIDRRSTPRAKAGRRTPERRRSADDALHQGGRSPIPAGILKVGMLRQCKTSDTMVRSVQTSGSPMVGSPHDGKRAPGGGGSADSAPLVRNLGKRQQRSLPGQREELLSGRRTARTFPLLPPPQKKRSPPSDSSPEIPTPAGISILSRTFPV